MRAPTALLAACLLAFAGCGSDDEAATPAACLVDAKAFVEALDAAPKQVTLDGTTIGGCLTDEQGAGQIADVGKAVIAAATELNEQARKQPLGDEPVRLGYLVGAVKARAEETGGIHSDLARSVESAATFIPRGEVLPGGFQQRYEEGLEAGRASG